MKVFIIGTFRKNNNHWGLKSRYEENSHIYRKFNRLVIRIDDFNSICFRKDNLLTNRIPIPPTDGRNMFGVADETGVLEYGQCFIQYSDFDLTRNGQRKYHVVKGQYRLTFDSYDF